MPDLFPAADDHAAPKTAANKRGKATPPLLFAAPLPCLEPTDGSELLMADKAIASPPSDCSG